MLGFLNIIRCVLLGKVEVHKPKKVELSYPMRRAFAELREVNRLREDIIVELYRQAAKRLESERENGNYYDKKV